MSSISRARNIKVLKAIGEETRFRIVELLLKRKRCACEIPKIIKRTQSNTSMHLSKLDDSGIVHAERNGKKIVYSIKDPLVRKIMESLERQGKKTPKQQLQTAKVKKRGEE